MARCVLGTKSGEDNLGGAGRDVELAWPRPDSDGTSVPRLAVFRHVNLELDRRPVPGMARRHMHVWGIYFLQPFTFYTTMYSTFTDNAKPPQPPQTEFVRGSRISRQYGVAIKMQKFPCYSYQQCSLTG